MFLELTRPALVRTSNLIDGKWVEAARFARYPVINPANGKYFADAADSSPADARAATDAASRALPAWRATLPRERVAFLRRWQALILANLEDIARIMSTEQGKPLAEARGEVRYGIAYVEWFAEEAARVYGDIIPQQQRGKRMTVVKEPVGVVAAITPWNFPLAMIIRKIAPALAVGCTVVAKPAEDTPFTALALALLAQEAGLPNGALNMISASREHGIGAVDDWLNDVRVRKITFTGSTAVGKHLARASGDTLKKLSLELGGNAPFIVFDDADLDAAVAGLMVSKFRNGGQTCVCPNRVYVQAGIYDAFAKKVGESVTALKVGPATDDTAQIGPMINARAVDKIARHVDDAVSHGARVLTGGRRLEDLGPNYYAPTVLLEANNRMAVCREETFGPIVPLFRFEHEEDAIRAANDTAYGLAAYYYTRDVRRIHRVATQLEVGMIGVNDGAFSSEVAPIGGVKDSGYGREGSRYGLDDFLTMKYVCEGGLD